MPHPESKILHRDYEITPESISDDEYLLRKNLFFAHHGAGKHCDRYGDDGELQCHTCDIDFVRDSATDIDSRLSWMGLQRLIQSPTT